MLHQSVLSLIHNTPLLKLARTGAELERNIYLKLEGSNPSGSIEDRIARSVVESAESRGDLAPGAVIVESSSPSMAISLAMIARQRRYKLHCIATPDISSTELGLLTAFGAEVSILEEAEPNNFADTRAKRARKALEAAKSGWWFDRYATPDLIGQLSHRIGAEIVRDIDSVPRWIVAPQKTTQLLTGLCEYFKGHWPDTRVMSVEHGTTVRTVHTGSIRLSAGDAPVPIEFPAIDARAAVDEEGVRSTMREMALQESILLGPLSALALAGIIRNIGRTQRGDDIVVLAPDLGWKHLDLIFQDANGTNPAVGAKAGAESVPFWT